MIKKKSSFNSCVIYTTPLWIQNDIIRMLYRSTVSKSSSVFSSEILLIFPKLVSWILREHVICAPKSHFSFFYIASLCSSLRFTGLCLFSSTIPSVSYAINSQRGFQNCRSCLYCLVLLLIAYVVGSAIYTISCCWYHWLKFRTCYVQCGSHQPAPSGHWALEMRLLWLKLWFLFWNFTTDLWVIRKLLSME